MLTMIANAMYFKSGENYETPAIVTVGPFRFSLQQVGSFLSYFTLWFGAQHLLQDSMWALLQLAYFTLGPDATLNTEIHKNSVRIKAPNSVNASKRKHKKSN